MLKMLIDTLVIREKRIFHDIQKLRECDQIGLDVAGGMVIEGIVKSNETFTETSKDSTTNQAKPAIMRIIELENALSKVQEQKKNAILAYHKMQLDDERLRMEKVKFEQNVIMHDINISEIDEKLNSLSIEELKRLASE